MGFCLSYGWRAPFDKNRTNNKHFIIVKTMQKDRKLLRQTAVFFSSANMTWDIIFCKVMVYETKILSGRANLCQMQQKTLNALKQLHYFFSLVVILDIL